MLQVANIRAHKEAYIEALKKRNFDAAEIFSTVLEQDEVRRATQNQLDETLAESNKFSKVIEIFFKNGEQQKANILKEKTAGLKERPKKRSDKLNETSKALQKQLYKIPNIPSDLVPAGNSEADNL